MGMRLGKFLVVVVCLFVFYEINLLVLGIGTIVFVHGYWPVYTGQ